MNRRILAIPLAIALVAIIGASLAPVFLTPPVTPCTYLSTPVRFLKMARRASSYLSPRSCGQWRHIFAARGRSDDRVAFRVERDGRDVRPVARMA